MKRGTIKVTLPASSLIICTRNRGSMLLEAVASILEGEEVPSELIIVDQSDAPNPTVAALAISRGCDIRYFPSSSRGLSRARNEGLEQARYSILAFTDDDVIVSKSWYRELIGAVIREGEQSVVTGQVRPEHGRRGGFVPSTKLDSLPAEYEGRVPADVLYTLNTAFFASAVERVGDFDVRLGPGTIFPGGEDNDFCFRLLEAGYRVVYYPGAVVYHRAWRSNDDYLRLKWDYGRGQGGYLGKHISIRDRYMLRRLFRDVGTRLRRSVHRFNEPRRALGDVVYALGVVAGAALWLLTEVRDE